MPRFKFCVFLFVFCLSCQNKIKHSEDNRIIYELKEEYSEYFINYFETAYKNTNDERYNLKKQFVEINGIKQDFTIHFDICDEYNKYERYVRLTNRFLKLSDDYLIPIVPGEDDAFSIKENKTESNVIKSRVGSSAISFIVIEGSSIQKLSIM
ncbi:hypothetical protein [uncultured Psychroserpens sp.]|uniref:hypothetical protein n=1 Tax=uncultured Psychroserpens sp. TaxID=255436 RepID=UPI0026285AB0|nr:hypothetical protein [uncultured Psychroserpens sp.]